MEITLRKTIVEDLKTLFDIQADEKAIYMAAFTAKDPFDEDAYITKWKALLKKEQINMYSVLLKDEVIGVVGKYLMEESAEITYAIAKSQWGKGYASKAVSLFLRKEMTRPIFGRMAYDNFGSMRVLEKNRFEKIGESNFFANGRGKEIKEFIFRLS